MSATSMVTGPRPSPYPSRVDEAATILPRVDPVVWGNGSAVGPFGGDEIIRYATDGFLTVTELLDHPAVQSMRREVDRLVGALDPTDERLVIEPGGGEVRSIFAVHELSELFAEVLTSPQVVDPVRQILGDEVYIHQSRVNRKPGFRGKEFSWHSDFETWHTEDGMPRMRALSLSIALSQNRADNGSLMIIPGSHRHFVSCVGETPANHYRRSLRNQEIGVPDEDSIAHLANEGGIETCVGPAGSATFFDCNCMHGSNGNITPFGRTNVFVVYNAVANAVVEPFSGRPPRPDFLATRTPRPI